MEDLPDKKAAASPSRWPVGLVIVCLLVLIAILAIPKLLRSRLAAHETSVANSVRALNTAEVRYAT